jgi:hypothetical protein
MEMMAASGQVIERRTRPRSDARAMDAQWGTRRSKPRSLSGSAMSRHMVAFPMNDALSIWHAWARHARERLAPYHSRVIRNARPRRR